MNDITANLTLDLNCNKDMPTINSAQFDKGRKLTVSITADGVPFSVTGCEATFKCIHSNKTFSSLDCTDGINETGTTVTITFRDDTFPVRGITAAKLVFTDGSRNYSTQIFLIDVDPSLEGDIRQSEGYSVLNRLIDVVIRIKNTVENISHKKSSISNQSQTGDSDTNYPTVGAVRDYTNGKVSELENYVDDELDNMDDDKANKATTLSGYGITNAYTKSEVDAAIAAAIGGVENGSY